MTTLDDLGHKYRTDKATGHGNHGYLPQYATHLPQDLTGTILEIGVAGGASLHAFTDYFSKAYVIGIEKFPVGVEGLLNVVVGDGTLAVTYEDERIEMDKVSVVIDDGSHFSDDIADSFELLWPQLKSGTWYIIEDLAVQWNADYGEGRRALSLLQSQLLETLYNQECSEFHAYNEIVFMRKL